MSAAKPEHTTYAAPAKINLYLHVVGRREDGYHLIDSLVGFVDVGDRLAVGPADDVALRIEGPFAEDLSGGPDNLIIRAAEALAEAFNIDRGAELLLTKNLPIASGIGGGSSDAAAALKALTVLWRLPDEPQRLADIALSLGADVPVCLYGRPARIQGIGERITPAPSFPAIGVVLANPGVSVSTAHVYRGVASIAGAAEEMPPISDISALIAALSQRRNDLAEPAIANAPVITAVLDALGDDPSCRLARLSGSGATCFGLYSDERSAQSAAERIRSDHPDWWVVATQFRGDA